MSYNNKTFEKHLTKTTHLCYYRIAIMIFYNIILLFLVTISNILDNTRKYKIKELWIQNDNHITHIK